MTKFISGRYIQRYQYKSFEPSFINDQWLIDNKDVILLLSKSDKKIGELNAFSELIPDIDFFIKMHIVKESTLSSRIEGTQTNIEEAIQTQKFISPEKRDDWQEVQNYIQAMNYAIKRLNEIPLSNRLLKETHKILLEGVRGEHKQPGEFRKSQNWVGGNSLNDASFIPPSFENLEELMSDFEKFLHNKHTNLPDLIKIAIAHYQFETIHPFLDGNGRIGRLLITLYLVNNNILTKPTLYLSDFFEKNRSLYYDNLNNARVNNNLIQWIKFFLEGIYITAENSINTFRKIISLKSETENIIINLGRKQTHAKLLIQYLYGKPIININEAAEILDINFSTASRLINELVKAEILREKTGFKKNKVFMFEKYLRLFNS
ncbi:MAG: Fic family protein [Elusimicrobia bacterium]|nr:Fic family protein [Elusimicrobiota bacterium]